MMTKTQTQTDTKSSNQSPEMTINVLDAPLISLNLAGNVGNRFILHSPTRHFIFLVIAYLTALASHTKNISWLNV